MPLEKKDVDYWLLFIKKHYTDQWGLVTQKNKEGGDSCQRTCMLAFMLGLMGIVSLDILWKKIKFLKDEKTKLYRRHPDPDFWGSNPNTFSRDQWVPLATLLGYFGYLLNDSRYRYEFNQLFKKHLKRFGFCWNTKRNWQYPTLEKHKQAIEDKIIGRKVQWDYSSKIPDFLFIHHWGVYIRGFNKTILWPLLFITDLGLVLDAMLKVFASTRGNGKTIDNNFIVMMLQAQVIMPTPLIFIAKWIYSKKVKLHSTKIDTAHDALWTYFKNTNYPPIHHVSVPLTRYYFL